jgi:hypothetical protein
MGYFMTLHFLLGNETLRQEIGEVIGELNRRYNG